MAGDNPTEDTDLKDRAVPDAVTEAGNPKGAGAPARPASEGSGNAEGAGESELSPEEQMARFEEALKDEDWGHQPC